MIYYRFPLVFTIAIALSGVISLNSLASESEAEKIALNQSRAIAQLNPEVQTNTESATELKYSYGDYLQAATKAETQGDYQGAIKYFEQALKLRPQDAQVKIKIRNLNDAWYDSYMQAGYTANRDRNLSSALNNFQAALKLRPDSPYAQRAVNNVNYYLKVAEDINAEQDNNAAPDIETEQLRESQKPKLNQKPEANISKFWSLIGIGVTSVLSLVVLWMLFRRDPKSQYLEMATELVPQTDTNQPIEDYGDLVHQEEITPADLSAIAQLNSAPELTGNVAQTNSQVNGRSPVAKGEINYVAGDTLEESSQNMILEDDHSRVGANSLGKVTIVTSQTTEIDLVFELIKDLQQSDRELRRKAIWELAQTSDSRGIQPLVEIMPLLDSLDKSLILDAITKIAERSFKPLNNALVSSLNDQSSEVRKNAIRDLTILYESVSQITKRLNQMMEDSDQEVQQTAKWALKQFNQVSLPPINHDSRSDHV
jgi:tetratricopeptide (TPR) repeat protein